MTERSDKSGEAATSGQPIPLRPRRNCPECGSASVRDYYPFCSRRCADLDLGRWLGGKYRIPDPDGTAPLRLAEQSVETDPDLAAGRWPGKDKDGDI